MLHARLASVSGLCRPTARSKALPDDSNLYRQRSASSPYGPADGGPSPSSTVAVQPAAPVGRSCGRAAGASWTPSMTRRGCPGRWNARPSRHGATRSLVDATRVVGPRGAVRQETSPSTLSDQIVGPSSRRQHARRSGPVSRAITAPIRRRGLQMVASSSRVYRVRHVSGPRAFTFTHSREPGTVDDELWMPAPAGIAGEVQSLEVLDHAVRESCDRARTGRGTASRRSTSESHPSDEGAGAKDQAERQRCFDGLTSEYCSCPPRLPTRGRSRHVAIASGGNHEGDVALAGPGLGRTPASFRRGISFCTWDALSTSRRDHAPSAVTMARAATNTCFRARNAAIREHHTVMKSALSGRAATGSRSPPTAQKTPT